MTNIRDLLQRLIWSEGKGRVRINPDIWRELYDNPRRVLTEVFNEGVYAGRQEANGMWLKEANRPGGAVRWAPNIKEDAMVRVTMVRVMYEIDGVLYPASRPVPAHQRHLPRTWHVVRNGVKGAPLSSRRQARLLAEQERESAA